MPNYPSKFTAEYSKNFKVKIPFAMSSADEENYRKYAFAKQQYEQLTYFLNNRNSDPHPKTGEVFGYGKNSFGFEKELDEDMLSLLKQKTENLLNASKTFIENLVITYETKLGVEGLMFEARRDYETSVRINTTLETAEPGTMSYLNIYNRSTEATIDMGETEVQTVGASLSSRLALKYVDEKGNLQKGFFTRDTATGNKLNLSKMKAAYPKLTNILTEVERFEHRNGFSADLYSHVITPRMKSVEDFKKVLTACGVNQETLDATDFDGFKLKDAEKIQDEFVHNQDLKEIDKDMGIEAGNNLNQRNTFMSDMAEALGRPDLLAKSKPMTIMENGEVVHGNFMENASGYDYDKIEPADPFFNGEYFSIDYEKVVKDVADMMIIDYICLNGDRHQNNMFYKFSKDENGDAVLDGIQGIDNDLSFGNKVPDEKEPVKFIPPLIDTHYITKSMKEKVMGLTEEKIYSMFAGKGLGEEEIEACWERTQKLQDRIRNSKEMFIVEERNPKDIYDDIMHEFEHTPNIATPVSNIESLKNAYKVKHDNYRSLRYEHTLKAPELARKKGITKDEAEDLLRDVNLSIKVESENPPNLLCG